MRDLGGSRASQRPRHSARPSDERASPTRAIELGPYRDYFRRVSLHVTPCKQSWSGHSVLYDISLFLAPAAGMGAAGGPSSARASPTDRQCPTPTQSNMGAASAQGCLNISGVCSTSNEEASSTPGPPTFWQREPLSHGRVVAALASFREPQSIRCLVSDPKVLGSEAEGRVPIAVLVLPSTSSSSSLSSRVTSLAPRPLSISRSTNRRHFPPSVGFGCSFCVLVTRIKEITARQLKRSLDTTDSETAFAEAWSSRSHAVRCCPAAARRPAWPSGCFWPSEVRPSAAPALLPARFPPPSPLHTASTTPRQHAGLSRPFCGVLRYACSKRYSRDRSPEPSRGASLVAAPPAARAPPRASGRQARG